MDDVQILKKRIAGLEKLMLIQAELVTMQHQFILKQEERLDRLVATYRKIQKVADALDALAVGHNKKYDERVDEVIDIIISKQKYKM